MQHRSITGIEYPSGPSHRTLVLHLNSLGGEGYRNPQCRQTDCRQGCRQCRDLAKPLKPFTSHSRRGESLCNKFLRHDWSLEICSVHQLLLWYRSNYLLHQSWLSQPGAGHSFQDTCCAVLQLNPVSTDMRNFSSQGLAASPPEQEVQERQSDTCQQPLARYVGECIV